MLIVECKVCFKEIARFEDPKQAPKKIECPHCTIWQDTNTRHVVGRSHKRNYPQGFWENQ